VLAFLTNIGLPELTIVAALAVIIFGKRLPEVAAKAYAELVKLRHGLDRVRRDTGLDRELREIEYSVRDAARKAALETPPPAPAELRVARGEEEEQAEPEAPGDEDADADENEDVAPPEDDLHDRRESV